ncbi:hypothetical protein AB4Z46_24165 [Variovorax sp. M-6]
MQSYGKFARTWGHPTASRRRSQLPGDAQNLRLDRMIVARPALHRLVFAALLALASAGAVAQGAPVPAAPEFSTEALTQLRRVATDDPQVQRSRWGDLALVAGKAWLQSVPGDVAAVWRDIRWIVPGAAMRYHRGFCVAQQCQGTVYLVRWDEKSGQLEFLDQGQASYIGRVQGDGSVRLAGTGLVGVFTAEALSFDRASTILYSDKHELKPVTAAQLAAATRGMAGNAADKGPAASAPAPSATENEKLRAELAAMKAKMDLLSKQVEQQGTSGGASPKPVTAAEAREAERRAQREAKARAAEEQRQAAEARAREQAEAKARAAEEQRLAAETRARELAEAKARAREEAQAKAAEAQRANAEARAREEEARRAASAEAKAKAEEAKGLAAAEAPKVPRGAGASSTTVATSAPAPAAPTNRCGGVDGVYGVVASNYRIEVKFSGDKLMVVEPNRTSPYQHMGNCQYLFVHPNGTRYMLGVVSRGLVAYKEGQDDSQKTPLALIQVSAAPQTDRRCTAERIPVQNVKALHPDLTELFGSRGIPGVTVDGTYNAPERNGHPLTRLNPNGGSGTFEVHGAPKPQYVYTIERWYIQANCDGTLVKEDHPAATRYYLIYKLDREYDGLLWHRDALDVAKSGGGMFIDDRSKASN